MIDPSSIYRLGARLLREGGKGARRIPDSVLQRDYCLAWFLSALGRSELMKRIVFNGGTALKRCYFGEYRFSEDLDFTFETPADIATVRAELEHVDVSDEELLDAVKRKMDFRKRPFADLGAEFKKKEARLKAQWEKSLSQQMTSLPEFEGVFRAVQRCFRAAGLLQ